MYTTYKHTINYDFSGRNIEFYPSSKNSFEVILKVEITKENDGIGGYEFWGVQGFDEGEDYYDIDIDYDDKDYTPEQNAILRCYLNDKDCVDNLEEEIINIMRLEY